jgi:SET domain-containing protein
MDSNGEFAMLYVPTYLAASRIHGVGLFARNFIPKGTLVWRFHSDIDQIITVGTFNRLPQITQRFLEHYASRFREDMYLLCGDDARFVNHSVPGNISVAPRSTIDGDDIAVRDIQAEEEITENYAAFDLDWDQLTPDIGS